ncbi:hypothetical protein BD779DRAFT_440010 [Infundibulicybe gibba]|nr:hypothetical protein BD779DRAFT_440010 [Infundibulicybe gibba]
MSARINLDRTLGVAFLGNIVAAVTRLYGIICIQAFIFLKRGSWKDIRPYCLTISVLWIMDTANLALTTHALYYYMISNYGDARALASPTWSLLAQLYMTCVSNLVVRYIFGRRAWSMTGQRILLTICILVPSLITFATGFAFGCIEWKIRKFTHFSNVSYLLYLSFGSGFVADGIIAVTLCAALWRSRTGFPRTDSILKTLMLYTINTGLLTSFCTLACFVAYAARPQEFIFLAFYCILSKMYLNSLLAILNGQNHLHERAAATGAANIFTKQPVHSKEHLYPPNWSSTQHVGLASVLSPVLAN